MAVSLVELMGNITIVEMTVNNTGSAFIRGSLAVSQGKDANGEDKETLWFNLKAWGDLAENIAETYQNTTSKHAGHKNQDHAEYHEQEDENEHKNNENIEDKKKQKK